MYDSVDYDNVIFNKQQDIYPPSNFSPPLNTPQRDSSRQNNAYRVDAIMSSPTAQLFSDRESTGGTGGINFNIQPLQKPTVLNELTHAKLKMFKSEYRHHHGDTKGKATLSGHMTDQMVSAIDTALGGKKVYVHLLGHGSGVDVGELSEDIRESYPWLHDCNNWENIINALLIIKPAGGNYNAKSYEQCLAKAEEANLDFALRVEHSGEDDYYFKLVEDAKRCELLQATGAQKKAYYRLLITGSRVHGSRYTGFNVSTKSLDKDADRARIDVMKDQNK